MAREKRDLTGEQFGRWTVLRRGKDKITPSGKKKRYWWCKCLCGTQREVDEERLIYDKSHSCGDCVPHSYKQYNKYDLSGDYGIGYTSKGEPFYFDKEDLPLIKNYTWMITKAGYVRAVDNTKSGIMMHVLIMNPPEGMIVDHIGHRCNDNRKQFLRLVTPSQNTINSKIRSDNKTGVTGVTFEANKYRARIKHNGHYLSLGMFDKLEDAAFARKEAEKKYYGQYAYNASMELAEHNKINA